MTQKKEDLNCCITSCDVPLDQSFWDQRWENNETGWDIGYASPAIVQHMQDYSNKEAAILIPGCGNAYEAEFLVENGFTNITVIDIAPKAVEKLQEKFANTPQVNVLREDYFSHSGSYDLQIEQTFFCAIPPNKRKAYAQKAHELLKENGKIIGLLFDKKFEHQGPPFGGCPCEYKPIFEPYFRIDKMDLCENSIPPRAGDEVFIDFLKK